MKSKYFSEFFLDDFHLLELYSFVFPFTNNSVTSGVFNNNNKKFKSDHFVTANCKLFAEY